MPDVKISELHPTASVATTDILPVVTDPGGTPASENITVDNFQKSLTRVGLVAITQPETEATIIVADKKTLTVTDDTFVEGTNTGDQTITLTGDVTGTGTGSFATTIANNAVTTAKINNGAVTEAKITLADNTTNNVTTSAHGFVPKGTNVGDVLFDNGAYASITTFHKRCSLAKTGSQAVTTGADRTITWNSELIDTDAMHDNATDNERITIVTAGDYLISASIMTDGNAAVGFKIKKNVGGTVIARTMGANGNPQGYSCSALVTLAVNDYIFVTANVGSNCNVTAESTFYATRI